MSIYDEDGNYLCEAGQFDLWIGGDSTTDNGTRIKLV